MHKVPSGCVSSVNGCPDWVYLTEEALVDCALVGKGGDALRALRLLATCDDGWSDSFNRLLQHASMMCTGNRSMDVEWVKELLFVVECRGDQDASAQDFLSSLSSCNCASVRELVVSV